MFLQVICFSEIGSGWMIHSVEVEIEKHIRNGAHNTQFEPVPPLANRI